MKRTKVEADELTKTSTDLYLERGNGPSTGTAPPKNRMIVIIAGVGFYLIG
jgi:hypothetical protein